MKGPERPRELSESKADLGDRCSDDDSSWTFQLALVCVIPAVKLLGLALRASKAAH